ncbi:MAG: dTMP kinase [Streptococcaceae bacterium]|jgi:dTMP kinase|nr:dTMP kinase [Streptococcaceae bacterium]
MKSIFISFEGPEGAGKSTVLSMVLPVLSKIREIVSTREPGGVRIAEDIRKIVLGRENTALDAKSEMLLFAAARRVHLLEKIKPALEAGKVVLADRFIDSSVAYQGYAGGVKVDEVKWLNNFATDGLKPDLTLYFDIAPEIGLARVMHADEREKNRLDLANLAYHQKVVEGYLKLCEAEPERIVKIDASRSPEEVAQDVLSAIFERFPGEFA